MQRVVTDRTFGNPTQIPVVVLSMGVEWTYYCLSVRLSVCVSALCQNAEFG